MSKWVWLTGTVVLLGLAVAGYTLAVPPPRPNPDDLITVNRKVLQHNILIMSMAVFNTGAITGYSAAKRGDLLPEACPKGTDDFQVKYGGCK